MKNDWMIFVGFAMFWFLIGLYWMIATPWVVGLMYWLILVPLNLGYALKWYRRTGR